jgi:predicted RNA methylase
MRRDLQQFGLAIALVLALPATGGEAALVAQQPPPAPDVGFEPTTMEVAEAMLKLAGVGPGDVVYDLGSGDGRIVILAAETFGARGVGIELEPQLVETARRAARERAVNDRVSFLQGDLFAQDISPATVVTLYLWPGVNARLEAKLRAELRPGTRVVSNSFGIGSWIPDKTAVAPDGTEVLLWIVPRRPARPPDVAFVPTPEPVVREMLELAVVSKDDVVYDLGSGDGRIPILAAQTYGARAVGVELDPRLVEVSRQVAEQGELTSKVVFIEGDLFAEDVSRATVVTLCLSAEVNERLAPKLLRELRPGARIVSRQFPLANLKPDQTVRASDGSQLMLWTVGPRQ